MTELDVSKMTPEQRLRQISYCKGLSTPLDEQNLLEYTTLEMFLLAFSSIYHKAVTETS